MSLPKDFLDKMQTLLKEEYEAFINSYEQEKSLGLRVNTLKTTLDQFETLNKFDLKSIPWVPEGYFYQQADRPGKHPYHEAGVYYIQEPSAMSVGTFVEAVPGEKVLDLCAAPGGKSTHVASQLQQEGLLITNEIYPQRAKILSQNIERMGIKNAVVVNESPQKLAKHFPSYFDRIVVDAPCSGEGMFRKDEVAQEEWSLENVRICADRQADILEEAATMLKPGGRIVYSTCTFAPEENEQAIGAFIESHPEFKIESMKAYEGFKPGRREWSNSEAEGIEETYRLWPHYIHGEGHYVAVLRKTEDAEFKEPKRQYVKPLNDKKKIQEFLMFAKVALVEVPKGDYVLFGDQLYIVPEEMLTFDKLKVVRAGWHLGTMKKNRFEPSHALALSLSPQDVKHSISFKADSDEIRAYLRGETIPFEGEKGWYLICVDGYSLGWAKLANNMLKNHYPKGLRWN